MTRIIFTAFTLILAAAVHAAAPVPLTSFLEEHCVECHDGEVKKGGLNLDSLAFGFEDPKAFAVWTKVHDRVRDGEMPPAKKPRPAPAELAAALGVLDTNLHVASERAQKSEGRALARRMNRDELQNSLRDLLGIRTDYRERMPQDSAVAGFDKTGSGLSISGDHLQGLMAVADAALEEALTMKPRPQATKTRAEQRWSKELGGEQFYGSFRKYFRDTPEGLARFGDLSDHLVGFPRIEIPGMYRYRVRARAFQTDSPMRARLRVSGKGDQSPMRYREYVEFPPEGAEIEVTVFVEKNEMLRVSPIGTGNPDTRHRVGFGPTWTADVYQGPGLLFEWAEVEGPLVNEWPPAAQKRLLGDAVPGQAGREEARDILSRFLPRAFRRPVSEAEVKHYLKFYDQGAPNGFLRGLKLALKTALCSPHFLFLDAPPGPLDAHALAGRLAGFFWSSVPDDELRALADDGSLARPQVLRAQVERMLRDERAAAFHEGFLGQWLDLRKINATTPDERLYPEWDELLEWASVKETRMYFAEMLQADLGISHVLRSDFTFLNDRLAQHYGISGVTGVAMRMVKLPPDSPRGGFLSQAAVLKVTADGTVSSPVLRGKWVMDRILGLPVPPPPDGVPAIEPDIRGATTIRAQLDKHRADASCAACHAKMDPPGFALEIFDPIGGERGRYRADAAAAAETITVARPLTFDYVALRGNPNRRGPMKVNVGLGPKVDASGALPDGRAFADFREFREIVAQQPDIVARAFVRHLVTYATGAPEQYADRRVIEQILDQTRAGGHGVRSLIHALVQSPIFLEQ